jgi:flagellar basal-body rod protein FlgB
VGNNTISDAAIMAALGRQMTRAVARQTVTAGNLANLETPGYRAKEVTFATALDAELKQTASVPVATHSAHFGAAPQSEGTVQEKAGATPRRDGNNVQVDQELLALARAGGDFNQAQTVLSAKFRLIRYAINEAR